MQTIDIEIELLGSTFEATVEYTISGEYHAQTMTDPAEYPELEIENLTRMINDKEINLNDMFCGSEWQELTEIVQEYIDEINPREY